MMFKKAKSRELEVLRLQISIVIIAYVLLRQNNGEKAHNVSGMRPYCFLGILFILGSTISAILFLCNGMLQRWRTYAFPMFTVYVHNVTNLTVVDRVLYKSELGKILSSALSS